MWAWAMSTLVEEGVAHVKCVCGFAWVQMHMHLCLCVHVCMCVCVHELFHIIAYLSVTSKRLNRPQISPVFPDFDPHGEVFGCLSHWLLFHLIHPNKKEGINSGWNNKVCRKTKNSSSAHLPFLALSELGIPEISYMKKKKINIFDRKIYTH